MGRSAINLTTEQNVLSETLSLTWFPISKMDLSKVLLLIFLCTFGQLSAIAGTEPELFYFADPDRLWTKENIAERFRSAPDQFRQTDKAINLGLSKGRLWILIDQKELVNKNVVVFENAFLDQIIIHPLREGVFLSPVSTGDCFPYHYRSFNYIYANSDIPENTDLLCIEVISKGTMKVPVHLYTFNEFIQLIQNSAAFHYLYFGIIIVTCLLAFGIYTWLRNSIFILYALSILGTACVSFLYYGYFFKYFWPDNPAMNQWGTLTLLLALFNLLFIEKLLNIRQYHKRLRWSFIVYYAAYILIIITWTITNHPLLQIPFLGVIALFPFLPILAGILLFRKIDRKTNFFFLAGVSAFFLSVLIYMGVINGLIGVNVYTDNAFQIGSIIEIFFFNLALIDRVKKLKRKQEEILVLQKKMLEKKVLQRTLELTRKNDLIEEKNKLLENQHERLEKKVKKRTNELLRTNKELNDRNFRLEQFANVTAHNLRGPVATLLGLCSIFNKEDYNDPLNITIIQNIQESAVKVDSILKDLSTLLDHHQNANSLYEEVYFEAIFINVLSILKHEFEKSGGTITTDFHHAPSGYMVQVYIKNIFFNLISNGLKYHKERVPPAIEIRSYRSEEFICLEFRDHGIGIDLLQYKEKIFQPYQRFHINLPGKGLGLYTCKTQIENMGGKIKVLSEVNKGTCFTVFLPDIHPDSNISDEQYLADDLSFKLSS